MRSGLGQTLMARWFFAQMLYPLKWTWLQMLVWWVLKPFLIIIAWLFVLNWGKRMPTVSAK
jgi:hypothetical protein